MTGLDLEAVALPAVPWADLDARPDRGVAATRAWLDFLVETQRAVPVVARLRRDDRPVGWFTGAAVTRAGVKVLGAPMRGWTTGAMGFQFDPAEAPVDPRDAIDALARTAFGRWGCWHVELIDRSLPGDGPLPPGFRADPIDGHDLDLDGDDDALLARMTAHGRRDVRRAVRNGIEVEVVDPADPTFAAEHHAQVRQAFARRDQQPSFGVERVEALLRHLGPTGDLLALRARTPGGEVAATGLFPGRAGGPAELWMAASDRTHERLLPNEALLWAAMREWRDRGAVRLELGGGRHKAKYGGVVRRRLWVRCSRLAALETARDLARRAQRRRQRR